jgi:chemotaxis protein methyltransferase CheR
MIKEADKTNLSNIIVLEDKEYKQLSSFILNQFGIKLPPNKKTLLQCRLQKRLKTLNYQSFKEYTNYVFSATGLQEEVYNMIDAVSTNKTDFFREPVHFDFLYSQGLTTYLNFSGKNKLAVWSAGCSSGEEPYTLGMILTEFASSRSDFDFKILATDISKRVLQHAVEGIYQEEKTEIIPFDLKKKYLLKGINSCKNQVRIIPELRNKVDFRRYNLLSTDFSSNGKFDIIFCRNVLIYFEREVQYRILKQFCSILNPGGYLFLGHSESITGYSLPLNQIRPTIFEKKDN